MLPNAAPLNPLLKWKITLPMFPPYFVFTNNNLCEEEQMNNMFEYIYHSITLYVYSIIWDSRLVILRYRELKIWDQVGLVHRMVSVYYSLGNNFLKIRENRFFFCFRSAKCDKNKSKYFLCKLLFRYFLFMQTPHPCRVMWQS